MSPPIEITELNAAQCRAEINELIDLLCDAVDSGASVGFLPPFKRSEAKKYWQEIVKELKAGSRILLAARMGPEIVGAVQLELATKPNGLHRAEVQRLLVHRQVRRQGIGQRLMEALETKAGEMGRTLLVLDTRLGDAAEQLYRKLGYLECGQIPHYARGADGILHSTIYFYRWIGPRPEDHTSGTAA